MNKNIFLFVPMATLLFSCAIGPQEQQSVHRVPTSLVFEPPNVELAGLPNMQDLPVPASIHKNKEVARYTGIIKNRTRHEVSIPSKNSDATLLIPPNDWIEYTIWTRRSDVTAYHNGKPFYCLNLLAHPKAYPFMCKKYDFMAEIVKEEPVIRGPSKLKARKRLKRRS
jgi:hypothetical protein